MKHYYSFSIIFNVILKSTFGTDNVDSVIIIIIDLPRTHTTQRARRTNSVWQVQQG